MSYQPNPVDTSQIDLGQLGSLSETLAENTHEVWAQARMREGWTYGPDRNDELKQHPGLVRYKDLSEPEKDYDRRTSAETLKLILHNRYKLSPEDAKVQPFHPAGPVEADNDDMDDRQELPWLEKHGDAEKRLAAKLIFLRDKVTPGYREANQAARDNQAAYLRASVGSVVCAAVAVILAIYQLAELPPPFWRPAWLPYMELALVVASVLIVLADFQFKWRDSWLAGRSRAERLRSLKFRALLDPKLWSDATFADAEVKIMEEASEIDSISSDNLIAHLADADLEPDVPDLLTGDANCDQAIGSYYLRRRLVAQIEYSHAKAKALRTEDRGTRLVGPVLFIGVLAFVFAHVAIEFAEGATREVPANPTGKILIALAAFLPAAGAAFRVYRDGREAGRNHLRHEALHKRLDKLRMRLERPLTRKEQLHLMVHAEVLMASEHEQWLQLMKECEWFG